MLAAGEQRSAPQLAWQTDGGRGWERRCALWRGSGRRPHRCGGGCWRRDRRQAGCRRGSRGCGRCLICWRPQPYGRGFSGGLSRAQLWRASLWRPPALAPPHAPGVAEGAAAATAAAVKRQRDIGRVDDLVAVSRSVASRRSSAGRRRRGLDADEPRLATMPIATAVALQRLPRMNNGVFDDPAPADARRICNCIGQGRLPRRRRCQGWVGEALQRWRILDGSAMVCASWSAVTGWVEEARAV